MALRNGWEILDGESDEAWLTRVRARPEVRAELVATKGVGVAPTAGEILMAQIRGAGIAEPVQEYPFAEVIDRAWRFDFAWPDVIFEGRRTLALEIDGEVHRIRKRHRADMVKFNVAWAMGWDVIHFRPRQVRSGMAIAALRSLFKGEGDLLEILQIKDPVTTKSPRTRRKR